MILLLPIGEGLPNLIFQGAKAVKLPKGVGFLSKHCNILGGDWQIKIYPRTDFG